MSDSLWLVRTAENMISGPFEKEHVKHLILEGELGLQDEICAQNSYWISIHEREEVKAQLGIEVPLPSAEDGTGGTEELNRTKTNTISVTASPSFEPVAAVRGSEPPNYWRGFVLFLILAAIAIVAAVLRLMTLKK